MTGLLHLWAKVWESHQSATKCSLTGTDLWKSYLENRTAGSYAKIGFNRNISVHSLHSPGRLVAPLASVCAKQIVAVSTRH